MVRELREGSGKKKRLSFRAKVGYMGWARVSCVRTVGGGQMSKLFSSTSTGEAFYRVCRIRFKLFEHFYIAYTTKIK